MKTTIKGKIASIALIAVLVISMSAAFSTQTHGQAVSIPTYIFIQVSPNPVGVSQPIYMQCFLSKPTPTAFMNGIGDHYTGITIKITSPTGTVTTMGPYVADPTGGIPSLEFTPTQVGNYTFQASYPGQKLVTAGPYYGDTEESSVSPVITVIVQQALVPTISSPPLPTAYWDFPVEATNYAWTSLEGNWFGLAPGAFATTGGYDASGNFNPYSPAPTTAHVMWTKPTTFGGQPGGPIPGDEMHNFMTTTIISDFFEPIIIQGVLYYSDFNSLVNSPASWNAIDLATGQTLWTSGPGITVQGTTQVPNAPGSSSAQTFKMGEVMSMHSMQEYGSLAVLYAITGTTLMEYSPTDGMYLGNITGVPAGFFGVPVDFMQDENTNDASVGSLLGWYTSAGSLIMWNSTLCWAGGLQSVSPFGQEIVRVPATMPFATGDQWSVVLPTTLKGGAISPALSIARVTENQILLASMPSYAPFDSYPYAVFACYDAQTGAQLWIENVTVPQYHYLSILAANENVFVLEDKDTLQEWGYSLTNGTELWGPVQLPGNALSHLSQSADIAYGQVYTFDLGGYVTAINLATGAINWVYKSPSAGYNTPYGVYPIWQFGTQSIADGELFLSLSRMYDPPLFENATRLALNCTNGKPVWSILSFSGRAPGAVADGYLVEWNSYDAQIYTFGKGPSEITASVQNSGTSLGNSVLITGMVTDTSPGTKQAVQKANFPDGVPCVSDADMSQWMEYVYMQQPEPTNVTGVPVTLSVLDSNGNYRPIGTTTSDSSGFYSFQWTPNIPGKYTLYASFGGSQSYWPSSTETAFFVEPAAPTAPPYPTPVAGIASTGTVELGVAAVIIVIVICVAVLAVLMLRKRP
jgi:hypothetical protein